MNDKKLRAIRERYCQLMRDKNHKKALKLNAQLHREYSRRLKRAGEIEGATYEFGLELLEEAKHTLDKKLRGEETPISEANLSRRMGPLSVVYKRIRRKINMARSN
jgi:hypothetical protein